MLFYITISNNSFGSLGTPNDGFRQQMIKKSQQVYVDPLLGVDHNSRRAMYAMERYYLPTTYQSRMGFGVLPTQYLITPKRVVFLIIGRGSVSCSTYNITYTLKTDILS